MRKIKCFRKLKKLLFVNAVLLCFTACGNEAGKTKDINTQKNITANTDVVDSTTVVKEIPDYSDRRIPAAETFDGGDGTEEDPYRIRTAEQLALLSRIYSADMTKKDSKGQSACRGCYYILTEDIYLNDTGDYDNWGENAPKYLWFPIGDVYSTELHFDGGGHTIYGMYVDSEYVRYDCNGRSYSLFGDLSNSVVKNLNIDQGYIRGVYVEDTNQGGEIGGVAAFLSKSEVVNCSSNVTLSVEYASSVGGICGYSYASEISGCSFLGNMELIQNGNMYATAGGIVGDAALNGKIEDCRNSGSFSYQNNSGELYKAADVGGIVSHVNPGLVNETDEESEIIIENCVNEMNMDLGNCRGGGLLNTVYLSANSAVVKMKNCENKGNISSSCTDGVGGMIQKLFCSQKRDSLQAFLMESCRNYGDIMGTGCVGGIISEISSKYASYTLKECHNYGRVTAVDTENPSTDGTAGGIVAKTEACENSQSVLDCTNEGEIHSMSGCAGGIIGKFVGFSSIDLSTVSGNCEVAECKNIGNVHNDKGSMGTGGILGGVIAAAPYISIRKCENSGKIGGIEDTCAGGIVGTSDSVYASSDDGGIRISECVNRGNLFIGSDPELLTDEGEQNKKAGYPDIDESYKTQTVYVSVYAGTCLGGLLGQTRGALVERSVNTGAFEADDTYLRVEGMEDYRFQDCVNKIHPDETKILFVGGMVGGKLKGTQGNEGILVIDACYYADYCNRGVFDDHDLDDESGYNAIRVDSRTADEMAEQLIGE